MSTNNVSRLRLISTRAATTAATGVVVVTGGDALHTFDARDAGRDAAASLADAGLNPVVVETGPLLAENLEASQASLALIATLDVRLNDGVLQDICATLGIRCLGAPAAVARACANKAVAASRMSEFGVPLPPQRVVTREALVATGAAAVLPALGSALGPEVFIKPVRGFGGSGVKRVRGMLASAINNTFNYGNQMIVEQAISGTELSVLMTSGEAAEPFAIGVAEVTTGSTDPRAAVWARQWMPAKGVDHEAVAAAVAVARRAAWALNLSGLTIVDVIVDEAQTAYVIDVNAMIDWRADRAVPACLANSGITNAELIGAMLDELLARERRVA